MFEVGNSGDSGQSGKFRNESQKCARTHLIDVTLEIGDDLRSPLLRLLVEPKEQKAQKDMGVG